MFSKIILISIKIVNDDSIDETKKGFYSWTFRVLTEGFLNAVRGDGSIEIKKTAHEMDGGGASDGFGVFAKVCSSSAEDFELMHYPLLDQNLLTESSPRPSWISPWQDNFLELINIQFIIVLYHFDINALFGIWYE